MSLADGAEGQRDVDEVPVQRKRVRPSRSQSGRKPWT